VKVQEYVRTDGSNPYKQWFDRLDSIAAAKVAVAIYRLGLGNTSSVKWFEGIGEYKIDWGPGYRVYLAKTGPDLLILFGGGTKKTQASDIRKAKELLTEHKQNKQQKQQRSTEK
jgi:putative addiction module killer protein